MNLTLLISGFWLGTFKFLFAHWIAYGIGAGIDDHAHYHEIFISVTAGAWFSMAVFYFTSELIMKAAARKRHEKRLLSLKTGIPLPQKKKFTPMNKRLVKMKRSIGIYGITLIAPLLLSIPIGSIVCAKFYGHEKKTFPLMMLFTASYSFIMCFFIYLLK